jgi:hypothetical protein
VTIPERSVSRSLEDLWLLTNRSTALMRLLIEKLLPEMIRNLPAREGQREMCARVMALASAISCGSDRASVIDAC